MEKNTEKKHTLHERSLKITLIDPLRAKQLSHLNKQEQLRQSSGYHINSKLSLDLEMGRLQKRGLRLLIV